MKHIKLLVLSLSALVISRPPAYCTANTQADDIAALQAKFAAQEAELAKLRVASSIPSPDVVALHERLTAQEEELRSLRAAAALPPPAIPALPTATELLIKGAGVDPEDVLWRIRSGLAPHQAVEVALNEKIEAAKAEVVAAVTEGGLK